MRALLRIEHSEGAASRKPSQHDILAAAGICEKDGGHTLGYSCSVGGMMGIVVGKVDYFEILDFLPSRLPIALCNFMWIRGFFLVSSVFSVEYIVNATLESC